MYTVVKAPKKRTATNTGRTTSQRRAECACTPRRDAASISPDLASQGIPGMLTVLLPSSIYIVYDLIVQYSLVYD
jgi:hypothetical protein